MRINKKSIQLLKTVYNNLIRKLGTGDSATVFKGMLTLALGSSAARLIGIGTIPVITRLYTPEDYGVLALYISIISILTSLTTLKFSTALPLPKTDILAINIMALSLMLLTGFLVIISVFLYFFGEFIFSLFGMSEIMSFKWLIILGIAGASIYEILSLWATRKRQYKVIARTQFTQSLIGNGFKIILGLLSFKAIGLIFGQFLAQSSGVVRLARGSLNDFKLLMPFIEKKKIILVARYYREFAYFRLPSHTLLQISSNSPVLMMAALFNKEVTGQLSLAILAVSLPTGLIGQAMAKAFYAEIAAIGKRDSERIKDLTINIQKKLFMIGVPLTILIMIFSQPLFIFAFGSKWQLAGKYTTILAPFVLLQFTSNPLMQVLNILGSQKIFLFINILRVLGLGIIFLIFKGWSLSPGVFVFAVSLYLCIYYLCITSFIFFTVKKYAA